MGIRAKEIGYRLRKAAFLGGGVGVISTDFLLPTILLIVSKLIRGGGSVRDFSSELNFDRK